MILRETEHSHSLLYHFTLVKQINKKDSTYSDYGKCHSFTGKASYKRNKLLWLLNTTHF